MFENKTGQSYETYNDINVNSFEYKKYAIQNSLVMNEHKMLELKFNLSDAVLLGSGDSVKQTSEVLNKFQLGFDKNILDQDSYT